MFKKITLLFYNYASYVQFLWFVLKKSHNMNKTISGPHFKRSSRLLFALKNGAIYFTGLRGRPNVMTSLRNT